MDQVQAAGATVTRPTYGLGALEKNPTARGDTPAVAKMMNLEMIFGLAPESLQPCVYCVRSFGARRPKGAFTAGASLSTGC